MACKRPSSDGTIADARCSAAIEKVPSAHPLPIEPIAGKSRSMQKSSTSQPAALTDSAIFHTPSWSPLIKQFIKGSMRFDKSLLPLPTAAGALFLSFSSSFFSMTQVPFFLLASNIPVRT